MEHLPLKFAKNVLEQFGDRQTFGHTKKAISYILEIEFSAELKILQIKECSLTKSNDNNFTSLCEFPTLWFGD